MQNSSFARLPQGLDPELRRALEILVLKVDEAYVKVDCPCTTNPVPLLP